MDKILKSSARVPANLYVKREADKQIQKVIKEMLRPGYISVARQMGKTNLLQNAKRELENERDIIIYIDLSSAKYESSRQYFRSIIDTILEVHDELLGNTKEIIFERRKDQSASASGEHDRELRMILKSVQNRLVLILDEVDTLAKSSFSDEIFAQIRSIYFMRSTYSVLEKLTYILSGVIEPTKLIKNKDNSPFNIAEQIYLDDFTFDEFSNFVHQSTLFFDEEVKVEVFRWTSGNPRMTYEICSALEDVYMENGAIAVIDVHDVIQKIYLVDFNAAPIDHIRDIVSNNSLIRDAIKDIRLGINITDELKDQLYLYGIIESKFKSPAPKIKNKIIDLALSEEWLIDLETKTKGFYEFGLAKISSGNYTEGIQYILRYAESPDITDIQRSSAFFSIADAYQRTGDYDISNQYIQKANFDKKRRPNDYFFSILKQGINYFSLDQHERSFQCFEEIIKGSSRDINYYTALLNKAIFRTSVNFDENKESSLEIFEEIIQELPSASLPEDFKSSVIALSHYRTAVIKDRIKEYTSARNHYVESLNIAPLELKASILVGLIYICKEDEREQKIDDLINVLENKNLTLHHNPGIVNIEFTDKALLQSLSVLYEFKANKFETLLEYCLLHYYNLSKPKYELMYEVAHEALIKGRQKDIVKAAYDAVLSCKDISDLYIVKACQGCTISISASPHNDVFLSYATKALEYSHKLINYKDLSYLDIISYTLSAVVCRDLDRFDEANNFIDFVIDRYDEQDQNTITGDVITGYYVKAGILTLQQKNEAALEYYRKAFSLFKKWNKKQFMILSNNANIDEIMRDIRDVINHFDRINNRPEPLIKNKIQRNSIIEVKYINGKAETGKYKKYESDILNGKCFLVKNT